MTFPRQLFLVLLALAVSTTAGADDSPGDLDLDSFKPNKKISEQILAFGPDPESAERAAMIRSWKIAREGVFKVTNISLSSVDDEDYCILTIQHEIYEPPDTTRVKEMVVGFGDDPKRALTNARMKAMQRIRDNPRSRPNLKNSTLPYRSSEILPMSEEDERDFIENQIRFWGRGDNWRVFLKFEYLEVK